MLEELYQFPTAPKKSLYDEPSASHSRKRAFEVLLEAEYAKYGVTDGVLVKEEKQRVCGAIIKGWPGWCMAAVTRGWKLELIIVKDNVWDREIRSWFPKARVVEYGEATLGDIALAGAEVWFCDIDPPNKLNLWVSQSHYIITTRCARNVVLPWKYQLLNLVHSECGGVTTGAWTMYVYNTPDVPPTQPPPRVAGQDLSTILNTKIEGMPCMEPSLFEKRLRSDQTLITVKAYYRGDAFKPRLLLRVCFQKQVGYAGSFQEVKF